MDRDQETSRKRKRKAGATGSTSSSVKSSSSPRDDSHYPLANDLLLSLGGVSTADLEMDVEAVFDKIVTKDTNTGASSDRELRHERTISLSRLATDCNKSFRLTYIPNSLLEDAEYWQALREDLKTIGYVQENNSGLKPLFLSKSVFLNDIYCAVMIHLPLKYGARLALLRLFGKRAVGNSMLRQGHANFVAKVRQFFEKEIDGAQKNTGSRISPKFSKDDLKTVRMRIVLPTELTKTVKTWRPRTPEALKDAFLMSFLQRNECIEYFSRSHVPKSASTSKSASSKDVLLLSDFVWTDGGPLATTRYRFLCGISFDIDLSANFVLKQIFGRGQHMENVCNLIVELCKGPAKRLHKKPQKSKSTQS